MESLAYITRNLEDKLECHSINEIQYKNEIIPIDVKVNKSSNNISLTKYNQKFLVECFP